MAYMECLPASMRNSADCILKCKGGELLPCHSSFLASTSGELANLIETVKAAVDKKIEIPLEETEVVVEAFLGWMYSHKVTFDAAMAYRLAALAHRLNAQGAFLQL